MSLKPFKERRFLVKIAAESLQLGPFSYAEVVDLAKNRNLTVNTLLASEEKPETWQSITDTPLVYELPATGENPALSINNKPRPWISQRTRDFLLIGAIGNTVIVVLGALASINVMSLVFLLALAVIFNVSLCWVMFMILLPY